MRTPKEIPVTQRALEMPNRIQEVQLSDAPARQMQKQAQLMNDYSAEIDKRSYNNAYLEAQTTMTKEVFRIEQENLNDPAMSEKALSNWSGKFFENINDPEAKARLELQFTEQGQGVLSRATSRRNKIISDQAYFSALTAQKSAQDEAGRMSPDILSPDPVVQAAAAKGFQGLAMRIQHINNQTGPDGMPIFTAEQRFANVSSSIELSVLSAASAWMQSQPDKREAMRKIKSGELGFDLPNGEGGADRVNISEALSKKSIDVLEDDAKRQAMEQGRLVELSNQAPDVQKVENQQNVLAMLFGDKISYKDRAMTINKMRLNGEISDDFASEAGRYLAYGGTENRSVSDAERFKSFDGLSKKLVDLRLAFGGTAEEVGNIRLNSENMKAYQNYQSAVMKELNERRITEADANKLLGPVSTAVTTAIADRKTTGKGWAIFPGIQDAHAEALTRIDGYLKNMGLENSLGAKKELFTKFSANLGSFDDKGNYTVTGDYKTTGNAAKDEQVILEALKRAKNSVNIKNFDGRIDPENPPNTFVQRIPDVKKEHVFESVEQMEAAGLPDGTPVIVKGARGFARK